MIAIQLLLVLLLVYLVLFLIDVLFTCIGTIYDTQTQKHFGKEDEASFP